MNYPLEYSESVLEYYSLDTYASVLRQLLMLQLSRAFTFQGSTVVCHHADIPPNLVSFSVLMVCWQTDKLLKVVPGTVLVHDSLLQASVPSGLYLMPEEQSSEQDSNLRKHFKQRACNVSCAQEYNITSVT